MGAACGTNPELGVVPLEPLDALTTARQYGPTYTSTLGQ